MQFENYHKRSAIKIVINKSSFIQCVLLLLRNLQRRTKLLYISLHMCFIEIQLLFSHIKRLYLSISIYRERNIEINLSPACLIYTSHDLQIETSRYLNVPRQDRIGPISIIFFCFAQNIQNTEVNI